jgi:hypothetical protein
MRISADLNRLIEAAEPLWAGEAEVVRTYWDSPVRTIETDLLWLARQASKEFNGSGAAEFKNLGVFVGPVTELLEMFPNIDRGVSRHEAFDRIADVYDAIRPEGAPPLNPHDVAPWDEDVALNACRHKAMAEHGEIGRRATKFSEGGYCTLFREGMRLKGRGGNDDLSAAACGDIYEDEFGHMLSGIVGLDDSGLGADDWRLMTDLVVEILRHRIRMRNAEFSYPLSDDRVQAIFAGDIAPERFDFAKAEMEPA